MDPARRILLVDDAVFLDALAAEFAGRHWKVEACVTGRSAIDLVWRQEFDALVTAVRLPDMRGDVVYFGASALWPRLRTATIFLANDEANAALAQAAGSPYLIKPVAPAIVADEIERLLPAPRLIR
jgi:DNA-binding response OmpR family regulator